MLNVLMIKANVRFIKCCLLFICWLTWLGSVDSNDGAELCRTVGEHHTHTHFYYRYMIRRSLLSPSLLSLYSFLLVCCVLHLIFYITFTSFEVISMRCIQNTNNNRKKKKQNKYMEILHLI